MGRRKRILAPAAKPVSVTAAPRRVALRVLMMDVEVGRRRFTACFVRRISLATLFPFMCFVDADTLFMGDLHRMWLRLRGPISGASGLPHPSCGSAAMVPSAAEGPCVRCRLATLVHAPRLQGRAASE